MPQIAHIETYPIDLIKDERVPSRVEGFDSLPRITRSILAACPIVVTESVDAQYLLPFGGSYDSRLTPDDQYTLEQASPEHRRSFVLRGPEVPEIWIDEHEHMYRALTLKGNNFSHSQLIETATAQGRYIAYGLQESAIIERVLRASRLLREAGIGTEYIVGLAEPAQFTLHHNGMPIRNDDMDVAQYKQALANKLWAELPSEQQTLEVYTEIFTKLENSTFYISLRATDTEYRYYDAMRYHNQRERVYSQANTTLGTNYDIHNNDDWARFTTEQFVPNLAKNMARLHALGLAHRFPNAMNLSAFGSIVDLDSVHGEPLGFGDDPITPADIARDIYTATEEQIGSPLELYNICRLEILSQFLPLYFTEYAAARNASDDEVRTYRLAVSAALAQYAEDQAALDEFSQTARAARSVAVAEITKQAPDIEYGAVTEQWLDQTGDELRKTINEWLQEHALDVAYAMLMTVVFNNLNELDADEPDMFDICFGSRVKELSFENPAYELLLMRLTNDVLGDSYEHFVRTNAPELFTSETVHIPAELAAYCAEQISKVYDDGVLVDAWLEDTLEELLPQFKTRLNELAAAKPANYVLTDSTTQVNEAINVTSNNTLIVQTHGVDLPALLDYATQHNIELVMNAPIQSLGGEHSALWRDTFDVADNHRLLQIITDVQLDSSILDFTDPTDTQRVTAVAVDDYDQRFVIYVTEDSAGNRRFSIDVRDPALISALGSASQTAIRAALSTDTAGMPQLFDTAPYFVRQFQDLSPVLETRPR